MVKKFLSERGILLEERYVDESDYHLKSLVTLGYRTTPVTMINDQIIVGYKPKDLEAAIGN